MLILINVSAESQASGTAKRTRINGSRPGPSGATLLTLHLNPADAVASKLDVMHANILTTYSLTSSKLFSSKAT